MRKCIVSEIRQSEIFILIPFLSNYLTWAKYLVSLTLNFLIYKMVTKKPIYFSERL